MGIKCSLGVWAGQTAGPDKIMAERKEWIIYYKIDTCIKDKEKLHQNTYKYELGRTIM